MIMGVSFGRGVIFHDRNVLACAEVKQGTIHVWAEKITFRTVLKMWVRVVFSLPWYYHLLHLLLLAYLINGVQPGASPLVSPWWAAVYLAGFHFIFPRQLKQFHGAEHKVFSYTGEKKMEAIGEISRADIVNSGCSTNLVTFFFLFFLPFAFFASLAWSVLAGCLGVIVGILGEKYMRRYFPYVYKISAFLQRYVTTKEPSRIHLETAIRSYRLFQHYQAKAAK
jgi:hypothetical protein